MAAQPASSEGVGPLKRTFLLAGRVGLPLLLGWLALGWALSRLSTRVVDWYVMTDELLYERLALSIVHFHSPLPRIHGVLVPNVGQLYPLLLAGVYTHGTVPGALHDAHLLNAFVMSSAAIPAYLLALRATSNRWVAGLVAVGTVCVPWIVYSSFLLTEVVGYPTFLWALLGIQAATVSPSRRNGVLALLGIALAVLARTQFLVLMLVLPLVIVVYELSTDPTLRGVRLRTAAKRMLARQRTLATAYALVAAAVLALLALGGVEAILGTYADTVSGSLLPGGIGSALLAHLAVLALSVALLPFLVGIGWLLASVARPERGERTAFAVSALVTIVALMLEDTMFDLHFGGGVVRDRYFFYLVPLVLIACACGLQQRSWRRAWLLVPALLSSGGFLFAGLPNYGTLAADTPISDIDGYLRTSVHSLEAARLTLAAATILVGALYLRLSILLPGRLVGLTVALLLAVALPAETWYAYATLFRYPGTAGRPLTLQQGSVFDWVDSTVGTSPQVTMLPYPAAPGDYQASRAYWWDLEFWNESVGAAAYFPGEFEGTPSTFPRLELSFDPETGVANISPSRYVVQLRSESRFRIEGDVDLFDRGAYLIDTGGQWRADWITLGLYDDGWTIPGVVARVRVFPSLGQAAPERRVLELSFETRGTARPVAVHSDEASWHGRIAPTDAATVATVPLCLPARGFTDVTIAVSGQSAVYGDMRNINTFGSYRTAGALLSGIALFDGRGGSCSPAN